MIDIKPKPPCAGMDHLSTYIKEVSEKLIAEGVQIEKIKAEKVNVVEWGGNVTTSESLPRLLNDQKHSDPQNLTGSYKHPSIVDIKQIQSGFDVWIDLHAESMELVELGVFPSSMGAENAVRLFFLTNEPYRISGNAPPKRQARSHQHCKGCGARITWLKTESGGSMPINDWVRSGTGTYMHGMDAHWDICPDKEKFKGL